MTTLTLYFWQTFKFNCESHETKYMIAAIKTD